MTPPAPVDLAEMAREIVNHDIDADWTHDYQTPKWQAKEAQDAAAASILRALSSAHLAGQRVGHERAAFAAIQRGLQVLAQTIRSLVPEPPAPEKSK